MKSFKGKMVALFDLDGVVFNTEPQYTVFWSEQGRRYHPEISDFGQIIKGQTLVQIFDKWFNGQDEVQKRITAELDQFEGEMTYEYVPGVEAFLECLRSFGIPTAVVTSSNAVKMANVYREHPEFKAYFTKILTSEFFKRSKPDPDCYLLGANMFGVTPAQCVVFEDSFNGIQAGRSAGMTVVGLSTTNPADKIQSYCQLVIPDFTGFSVEKMSELLCQ